MQIGLNGSGDRMSCTDGATSRVHTATGFTRATKGFVFSCGGSSRTALSSTRAAAKTGEQTKAPAAQADGPDRCYFALFAFSALDFLRMSCEWARL